MHKLIAQLEDFGKAYRANDFGVDADRLARIDARVSVALHGLPETRVPFSVRGLSLLFPLSARLASRTAGVLVLFLIVAFSGWVTANAAVHTILPGSPFYRLKLASERAHIGLAFGSDARTELELEFAGRRLEEAAKLADSSLPNRDALLAATMDQFKNQMVTAQTKLEDLKSRKDPDAVHVARVMDRKAAEYQAVLAQTGSQVSGANQEEVAEARDAAQKTSFVAVTVFLDGQESGEVSLEEARQKVGDKLRELEADLQVVALRLADIPLDEYPEIEIIGGPTLGSLAVDLRAAHETLAHAKDLFAQGGLSAALTHYQQGIGLMNQLEWGAGLYEKVLTDRAAAEAAEATPTLQEVSEEPVVVPTDEPSIETASQ